MAWLDHNTMTERKSRTELDSRTRFLLPWINSPSISDFIGA
jgi:hypothetical protein